MNGEWCDHQKFIMQLATQRHISGGTIILADCPWCKDLHLQENQKIKALEEEQDLVRRANDRYYLDIGDLKRELASAKKCATCGAGDLVCGKAWSEQKKNIMRDVEETRAWGQKIFDIATLALKSIWDYGDVRLPNESLCNHQPYHCNCVHRTYADMAKKALDEIKRLE